MSTSYRKTHSSPKALKSHVSKIKQRGGKAVVVGNTVSYRFGKGGSVDQYVKGKNYPTKTISKSEGDRLILSRFPNFAATGSIIGMKQRYYGVDALFIKSGKYIYNVTSEPDVYFNI